MVEGKFPFIHTLLCKSPAKLVSMYSTSSFEIHSWSEGEFLTIRSHVMDHMRPKIPNNGDQAILPHFFKTSQTVKQPEFLAQILANLHKEFPIAIS